MPTAVPNNPLLKEGTNQDNHAPKEKGQQSLPTYSLNSNNGQSSSVDILYQQNPHAQLNFGQVSGLNDKSNDQNAGSKVEETFIKSENNNFNLLASSRPYLHHNVDPSMRRRSIDTCPNSQGMPPMELLAGMTDLSGSFNKASLVFDGNLLDMTQGWLEEEKSVRRRLVQFWRRYENNTIMCAFRSILPSERPPNSTAISCIYWEAKNDYFITSVDCILLLEALISVRFTVEEKNRIRRNLEGFRPLTISKCKGDTADFFKLIMAFPNPKPRNIEKDVKVFPWRVLSFALKKIVSKYATGFPPGVQNPLNLIANNQSIKYETLSNINYGPNFNYARTGFQRRYSQPVNMMNVNVYGQPGKMMPQNNQGHMFLNQQLQGQPIQENIMPNQGYPLSQAGMPNIAERNSYDIYNRQMMQTSTSQGFQRRHSLADPYSVHRTNHQQAPFLGKLSEEGTNFSSQRNMQGYNPNFSSMRTSQPTGLGIVEEDEMQFNENA